MKNRLIWKSCITEAIKKAKLSSTLINPDEVQEIINALERLKEYNTAVAPTPIDVGALADKRFPPLPAHFKDGSSSRSYNKARATFIEGATAALERMQGDAATMMDDFFAWAWESGWNYINISRRWWNRVDDYVTTADLYAQYQREKNAK